MGIHYSLISVQPRWNSPQDLLGYYDGLEGKYKATEFIRSLIRFEMFNRKDWRVNVPRCDDRSDRMLLMLLDEMNLADVDGYFSEFLSKLEARRGIDIHSAMDRVKAEIELEVAGQTMVRVFPGRNVLFAGTVNEDKCTLSLSDKVLDRSNVLYFGRPLNANIKTLLGKTKPLEAPYEGMTQQCWKEWTTNTYTTAAGPIAKRLNRLNEAMTEMGRPFGYRTGQAIATYMNNYPKFVARRQKVAFADQIEQRILPKLNGVGLFEHQAPLAKIEKLISETGDKLLHAAFAKSCQETGTGIFNWTGVDRTEVKEVKKDAKAEAKK